MKRAEAREMINRTSGSTHGIEASQNHDDWEKKEERIAKSEERRERREERIKQKEQIIYPQRGRQKSPNEAAREGPTLFLAMPPGAGTSGGFKGREKRAEKIRKRKEKRKNIVFKA